jgi:hypothetical protein
VELPGGVRAWSVTDAALLEEILAGPQVSKDAPATLEADEFDPTRAVKDHLAIGYGAHHCLGAPLARLEAVVALPAIFRRFPDMELAAAPEELGVVPSFISNGHHRLPVYLNGE